MILTLQKTKVNKVNYQRSTQLVTNDPGLNQSFRLQNPYFFSNTSLPLSGDT